jgi:hypothetical protein
MYQDLHCLYHQWKNEKHYLLLVVVEFDERNLEMHEFENDYLDYQHLTVLHF